MRKWILFFLFLSVTLGLSSVGSAESADGKQALELKTNTPKGDELADADGRDYVGLVNPWVEADIARYFFFKSANTPFGFVKLRPDTSTHSRRETGYRTTENEVKGFSHIHEWQLSGVQVMPTSGQSVPKTEGDTGWESYVEHDDSEVAEPGYHKLHLDRYNITAELTATDRVGLHRYTYDDDGPSEIIINLGGTLGEAVMENAHVTKVSDHEIEGFVLQHGGDHSELKTKLFFNIRFDKPFDSLHGWADGELADNGDAIDELSGDNMGVYVHYDHLDAGETVQMKVGLSLTGTDGARKNLEAELEGWDFEDVKHASQQQWNEMLGRIDAQGGTEKQQIKFYTDLFHVLSGRGVVSDVDGKYLDNTWNHQKVKQIPLDNQGKPKFAMYTYDALWLTQWNLNTILGLAYPEIYSSFVQSQLQMYKDGGLLPRGPVAGNDSLIMISSPVTSFINGAWNKGIQDFDSDLAYEAMLDAHSLGGLFDKAGREIETWGGNGGIREYLDLGYVPYDLTGTGNLSGAGQTLEYAFQDWTLAQLAQRLDKKGLNVSQLAEVSVSSQANEESMAGERAVDGRPIRSGYSDDGQNVEWVSGGETNPWIKLEWDKPQRIQKVVLSDRADPTVNTNAGILEFSDGSSVTVNDIPDDGSEREVSFAPKNGVTWIKFKATDGEGTSVGLNEIEVWDDRDMYTYLSERSRNWRNLFDESVNFIRPKDSDGQWLEPFNPLSATDFEQANSWQSTWFTSHDVMGLANLMGGRKAYADKLNYAFEQSVDNNFIAQHGQGHVSYGNQPGLQMAHLFNYVGKPWLSQYWVRQVKEKTYGSISTTDGYGRHDEDQGQMGSMSALMAMGLFEITGGGLSNPVYDITSPIFDKITIKLNQDYYKGKEFRIITHNNSEDNMYIQRAKLDGDPLDNAWFYHNQLADGGTLELWMDDTPNKNWGVDELPPSESEEEEQTLVTDIEIISPDLIKEPYGTVQLDTRVTPDDASYKRVEWSVTNPDGSPTDKATIDYFGALTVNDNEGDVLVTARAADDGNAIASKIVTIDLDLDLLRGNAGMWPNVTATASSEYSAGYAAEKVFDGVIGSKDSGDWASRGERNPWIQLDWEEPIRADKIILFDRSGQDNANGGTLTFSDGSSVEVDDIASDGSATTVELDMKTFEWVRFQIEGGTGPNPGLSEFEVYAVPSVPEKINQVSLELEQDEAMLSWKPPAFDGGAPLTGYLVTTYRDGIKIDTEEIDVDTTEMIIDDMEKGYSYEFTVAAKNLTGAGPASEKQGPSLSSDELMALVERFTEEGEFLNDAAARSLKVHLIAVSRYEEKELAEKVVKHLNGFKLLLDHQKENELISEKAYDILYANTEFVIKNWQ
jgi:predicted alpha-1,2-mannosidase